jgi:hypothetical protein
LVDSLAGGLISEDGREFGKRRVSVVGEYGSAL